VALECRGRQTFCQKIRGIIGPFQETQHQTSTIDLLLNPGIDEMNEWNGVEWSGMDWNGMERMNERMNE
jgi:hypothetical protein